MPKKQRRFRRCLENPGDPVDVCFNHTNCFVQQQQQERLLNRVSQGHEIKRTERNKPAIS